MPKDNSLRTHRTWEDWLGIALGVLIGFTPWLLNEISHSPAIINAALTGLAVLLLSELDLVKFRTWPEAGLLLVGVWLAVSPFILTYPKDGSLRTWHIGAGLIVAALGALGVWQRMAGKP